MKVVINKTFPFILVLDMILIRYKFNFTHDNISGKSCLTSEAHIWTNPHVVTEMQFSRMTSCGNLTHNVMSTHADAGLNRSNHLLTDVQRPWRVVQPDSCQVFHFGEAGNQLLNQLLKL